MHHRFAALVRDKEEGREVSISAEGRNACVAALDGSRALKRGYRHRVFFYSSTTERS